jgi:hypothetical protein
MKFREKINRIFLWVGPIAILCAFFIYADTTQKQIRKLQHESQIQRKQLDAVNEVDGASVYTARGEGKDACAEEKSFLIIRTMIGCSQMYYAKGLQNIGLKEDDAAIWSAVLSLANAYRHFGIDEGVQSAVRGAIQNETFRREADPSKVMKAIRKLPGKDPASFYADLARTSAGKYTGLSLTKPKEAQTKPSGDAEKTRQADPINAGSKTASEVKPTNYCDGLSERDCDAMRRIEAKVTGEQQPSWEGEEYRENRRKAWSECKKDPTLSGC